MLSRCASPSSFVKEIATIRIPLAPYEQTTSAHADERMLERAVNFLESRRCGSWRGVGAELVVHSGDLRHRWTVIVGHDRRPWRYDCYI
jgi:hypothetical protein